MDGNYCLLKFKPHHCYMTLLVSDYVKYGYEYIISYIGMCPMMMVTFT